jgi:hypothetical protein
LVDMSGEIFCEQRGIATKFGILEVPVRCAVVLSENRDEFDCCHY